MPHYIADGSVISNSISLGKKKTFYQRKKEKTGKIKARVEETIFSDDPRNSTYNTGNPQVEYTCTVIGGNEAGRRIFNVKSQVPLGAGSPYNTGEIVLTPNLAGDSDKDGNLAKLPDKTTGTLVLIDWVHGHEDSPIITGCLKHPKSTTATKTTDGNRQVFTYNGMSFNIDKDGGFSVTFGGGQSNKDGEAANSSSAGSSFSISATGAITFTDGAGQTISIDKVTKKISIIGSQDVDLTSGANWNIDVSGNATLTAGGNLDLSGGITNIGGGGGLMAARMNDIVLGVDGEGRPINAYVGVGSSTVLIGG